MDFADQARSGKSIMGELGPFLARVAGPAPATGSDALLVTVPSYDGGRYTHGPCLWEPPAGPLPAEGDLCVVVRALEEDGDGEITIVISFDRDTVPVANTAPTVAQASSGTVEAPGALGADVTYQAASLSLPAGTWRLDAWATLRSHGTADGKLLALWNDTAGAEIPSSRSAVSDAPATNVHEAFYTATVVTLTAAATIKLRGVRNGGSQVQFGYQSGLGPAQRLLATKLVA